LGQQSILLEINEPEKTIARSARARSAGESYIANEIIGNFFSCMFVISYSRTQKATLTKTSIPEIKI
jgi:hypothetical protein